MLIYHKSKTKCLVCRLGNKEWWMPLMSVSTYFTANWDSLWKNEGELILLTISVLWIQTRFFCGWQYIYEILPGKGGEKEFMMTLLLLHLKNVFSRVLGSKWWLSTFCPNAQRLCGFGWRRTISDSILKRLYCRCYYFGAILIWGFSIFPFGWGSTFPFKVYV